MTISLERYEAALAGAEPVTYHKAGCPATTSLGTFECDPNPKVCGALAEHRLKLRYAEMGKAPWFKAAHEGRSLGEEPCGSDPAREEPS